MRIETRIDGIEGLLGEIQGTPRAVDRAALNAVRVETTRSRKEIIDIVHRETRLKKKLIRQNLTVERAKANNLTSVIRPSGRSIVTAEFETKPQQAGHPTRARILARARLGRYVVIPGFINPRGRKRFPLQGKKRPPRPARGPSLKGIFEDILLQTQFVQAASADLGGQFREKLDDQLRLIRARRERRGR